MPDLILGPAGVLPPGEWAVGARVSRGGILSAVWDNAWVEVNYPHAAETQNDLLLELRLDLTTGPLDFGTRALLALLLPAGGGVEQGLCAPRWLKTRDGDWLLEINESAQVRFDGGSGYSPGEVDSFYPDGAGSVCVAVDGGADLWVFVPGIDDEPDPRRALALALHAAGGWHE
jgi:hypothetical protein